jgi:hypothetical protein
MLVLTSTPGKLCILWVYVRHHRLRYGCSDCSYYVQTVNWYTVVPRFIPLKEEDVLLEAAHDATLYQAPNATLVCGVLFSLDHTTVHTDG